MKRMRIDRKRILKATLFFAFSVIAVIVISLCIGGTVYSMERNSSSSYVGEFNRASEKMYTEEVREYLNSNGFRNAGVMLTHITSAEGVEYRLNIHHSLIDTEDMTMISEYIDTLKLDIPNSTLEVVFAE